MRLSKDKIEELRRRLSASILGHLYPVHGMTKEETDALCDAAAASISAISVDIPQQCNAMQCNDGSWLVSAGEKDCFYETELEAWQVYGRESALALRRDAEDAVYARLPEVPTSEMVLAAMSLHRKWENGEGDYSGGYWQAIYKAMIDAARRDGGKS